MLHNILLGIPMGPHFRRGRSKKLSLYKVIVKYAEVWVIQRCSEIAVFLITNMDDLVVRQTIERKISLLYLLLIFFIQVAIRVFR